MTPLYLDAFSLILTQAFGMFLPDSVEYLK